jgi:hypothetical protein
MMLVCLDRMSPDNVLGLMLNTRDDENGGNPRAILAAFVPGMIKKCKELTKTYSYVVGRAGLEPATRPL